MSKMPVDLSQRLHWLAWEDWCCQALAVWCQNKIKVYKCSLLPALSSSSPFWSYSCDAKALGEPCFRLQHLKLAAKRKRLYQLWWGDESLCHAGECGEKFLMCSTKIIAHTPPPPHPSQNPAIRKWVVFLVFHDPFGLFAYVDFCP